MSNGVSGDISDGFWVLVMTSNGAYSIIDYVNNMITNTYHQQSSDRNVTDMGLNAVGLMCYNHDVQVSDIPVL